MKTEKSYLGWAERFARFCGERRPELVGGEQLKDFLSQLALEGQVAAATQNQALNALVFVFKNVLERDVGELAGTLRARPRMKVPVALTSSEVKSLFGKLESRPLLIVKTMYAAGLRVSEVIRLRVSDLDCYSPLRCVEVS